MERIEPRALAVAGRRLPAPDRARELPRTRHRLSSAAEARHPAKPFAAESAALRKGTRR